MQIYIVLIICSFLVAKICAQNNSTSSIPSATANENSKTSLATKAATTSLTTISSASSTSTPFVSENNQNQNPTENTTIVTNAPRNIPKMVKSSAWLSNEPSFFAKILPIVIASNIVYILF